MRKIFKNKSGITFFTLDTLLAGMIILVTIILVLSIYYSRPVVEDTFHDLNNYMNFLSSTTMEDLRDNYQVGINLAMEEDLDLFVYQKIYKLYQEGNESIAKTIVGNMTVFIIPLHMGFEYAIGDEVVFLMNNATRHLSKSGVTNRLMTYYIDEDSNVEWNVTKITVWS